MSSYLENLAKPQVDRKKAPRKSQRQKNIELVLASIKDKQSNNRGLKNDELLFIEYAKNDSNLSHADKNIFAQMIGYMSDNIKALEKKKVYNRLVKEKSEMQRRQRTHSLIIKGLLFDELVKRGLLNKETFLSVADDILEKKGDREIFNLQPK